MRNNINTNSMLSELFAYEIEQCINEISIEFDCDRNKAIDVLTTWLGESESYDMTVTQYVEHKLYKTRKFYC